MARKNSGARAGLTTSGIVGAAGGLCALALLLTPGSWAAATDTDVASAQSQALSLGATLASTHVLTGNNLAYMAVTLQAPDQEHLIRPNVDLAVVFDRSGSMEGEKLSQAKLAARQLISGLESGDRVSLTMYGTDVEVLFPSTLATEQSKNAALMMISQIYTDGGTNMSGGLAAGRSQLLGLGASADRIQRIVLISDGQANEGIVGRDELASLAAQSAQQGVSITTVGIGLDFDEQTMTRIAVSGRGNYYFAESASMLAQLFATELSRLGATVATRVQLQIAPMAGVTVTEVLGYDLIREGDAFLVNVADMHAGETRKVIVALQVQAAGSGSMKLANLQTSFFEPGSTTIVQLSRHLSAEVTTNEGLVYRNRDKMANRLIDRARTAQAIEQATDLYEQGRWQEANRVIDAQAESVAAIAADSGDSEFAAEMQATQAMVKQNFAEAPAPSSQKGKSVRKKNRANAYKLTY